MSDEIGAGRILIHRARSTDTAAQFHDGYFDRVYIDADHTYEGVQADLSVCAPKVPSGGFITGDDYDSLGVGRAVGELDRQPASANSQPYGTGSSLSRGCQGSHPKCQEGAVRQIRPGTSPRLVEGSAEADGLRLQPCHFESGRWVAMMHASSGSPLAGYGIREYTNFTYDLTPLNKEHLAWWIARISACLPVAQIRGDTYEA